MKKILKLSSVLAVLTGVILIIGGIWGISFTYKNIVQEKIITPKDASIPDTLVKGPFTLKSQADIIRYHTLKITSGKTYAEMPRQVSKLDEKGSPVLDNSGNPVMVNNDGRNLWVTATTLTTALNLGIITYVFSGLVMLLGLISIWTGIIFWLLSKKESSI